MHRLTQPVFILAMLCTAIVACGRKEPDLTQVQIKAKTQLAAQMEEAAKTKRAYHELDEKALLEKLMEHSKAGVQSFNSPAYRELRAREHLNSGALVTLITQNGNAEALLPLLLLRRQDRESYLEVPAELRAKILGESLTGSKYFNEWGLPGFYQQDASLAVVETGPPIIPALKRLLSDTRPAPVFGSQEYMVYQKYQFRVCDYAFYFLEEIKGSAPSRLPEAPRERDALITTAAEN